MLERTDHALKAGALLPISTQSAIVFDSGVHFLVRIVSSLGRKAAQKAMSLRSNGPEKTKPNPFLPYEEDMWVADISGSHVCLLNKFNVIDHHLLIVTREFEAQEMLLTREDFEAIGVCMAEFDALAFYNGGKEAGASQPHKHLQMIPLPMAERGPSVPVEVLFPSARLEQPIGRIPELPFEHSFARLKADSSRNGLMAAEDIFRLYRHMLHDVGLNPCEMPEHSKQTGPYNLLLTREWMFLVPRSKECFGSISINALGFAGALLVQNEQQMKMIEEQGCMTALRDTAVGLRN
jgi:sulfate adenylyltransferase (ADP) / ATP adenylyltransferase